MKKLITTSLCAVAVAIGFSACSNGAYVANPKKDRGSVINPFDSSILYNVFLGSLQGMVDDRQLVFFGNFETKDGTRTMTAKVLNDTVFYRTITMVGDDAAYNGKKDEKVSTLVTYTIYDTTIKINRIYQATVGVLIHKDDGKTSLGEFNTTMASIQPEPLDPRDTVHFDVRFNLEKR